MPNVACRAANLAGDPCNVNDNLHVGQRGGKSEMLNKAAKLRKLSISQRIAIFVLKCLGFIK